MATIFGTNGNNTLIVEADDLRGLAGDDTYVITNALANNPANAGRTIVVNDTEGANRLQFADGLQITSIQFLGGNAIQVTLTNNIRIQVVGANAFTFDIGGNAAAGDNTGLIGRTFAQLASDFGVTLVGGAGTTAAPVTIQAGANPVAPPAPPLPTLSIAALAAPAAEGNAGTTAFTYTVTRTGDTTGASSVNFAVAGSGANPAVAADFVGGVLPTGVVNFAAGQTTQTVTVNVAGDTAFETNEAFTVTLSGPTGATLGTATATSSIVNDDPAPATFTLTPNNANVTEVNGAPTTYTVTASTAVLVDTVVTFSLIPGNGVAANAGTSTTNTNDFAAGSFNPVSVTILAGNTTATFVLPARTQDGLNELPETYTVQAVVAGTTLTATGTVLDNATPAGSIILTESADDVSTTSANPATRTGPGADVIFAGSVAAGGAHTLGAADTIDGSDGIDTLNIVEDRAVPTTLFPRAANVEIVQIQSLTAATVDFSNTTGVTTLVADRSTAGTTINNLRDDATLVLSNTNQNVNLNYAASAALDTKAVIELNNANGASVNYATAAQGNALTTLSLKIDGAATTIAAGTFTGLNQSNALTTLNLSGNANVVLNKLTSGAADNEAQGLTQNVTTVNASGLTGTLNANLLGNNNNVAFTGGSGNTTLSIGQGNNTVNLGGGNDKVILSSTGFNGNDKLDGGAGTNALEVHFNAGTAATGLAAAGGLVSAVNNSTNFQSLIVDVWTQAAAAGESATIDAGLLTTAKNFVFQDTSDDVQDALIANSGNNIADADIEGTVAVTNVANANTFAFLSDVTNAASFKAAAGATTLTLSLAGSDAANSINDFDLINTLSATGFTTVNLAIQNTNNGINSHAAIGAVGNFAIDVGATANITGAVGGTLQVDLEAAAATAGRATLNASAITTGGTTAAPNLFRSFAIDAGQSVGITGTAQVDSIIGSTGADILDGGLGNDTIDASTGGADTLIGGGGDDRIITGAGVVSVTGGAGNDRIEFAGTLADNLTSADIVDGGSERDTLAVTVASTLADGVFNNLSNVEVLELAAGSNATLNAIANAKSFDTVTFAAGAAANVLTLGEGFARNLTVNLANGTDTVDASKAPGTVTVNVNAANLTAADAITGGTTAGDQLVITADNGTATLAGVTKIETVSLVSDSTPGETIGLIVRDSAIQTGSTLTVSGGTLGGNATIDATNVATIDASKRVTITTGTGADTILGSGVADTVVAGSGNDSLTGGGGVDSLTGGLGADNFRYNALSDSSSTTTDLITDFVGGVAGLASTNSGDRIQVSTALLGAGVTTVNFVATQSSFGAAQGATTANDGKADYVFQSDTNTLWVDLNDDGTLNANDLQIRLSPGTTIVNGDVVAIDVTAPAAPTVDLNAASDSGASNTDNITNAATPLSVRFVLNGAGLQAPVAGDTLNILATGGITGQNVVLSGANILAGFVDVNVAYTGGNGVKTISATVTDQATNISSPIASLAVTIDTVAPATPAVNLADASDSGAAQNGNLAALTIDNLTNVPTVTIDGTAEANSTISISGGLGAPVVATANGAGVYTALVNLNLNSVNNLSVTATDAAGNTSGAGALAVTHDNTAPAAAAFTVADNVGVTQGNLANLARTDDNTLTFSGNVATAADRGTVTILANGLTVGTAAVDAGTGAWTFTTAAQTDGTLNYTTTLTDRAGNTSVPSAVTTLTVDTAAPTAPALVITSATGALTLNGPLNAGDVVTVTATFGGVVGGDALVVTGAPTLALNIGGTTVQAAYNAGGSNLATGVLAFNYTILAAQTDTNGISIDANAVALAGGSIRDTAGNNAVITSAAVLDNANFRVDTTAPAPTITAVDFTNVGAGNNFGLITVTGTDLGIAANGDTVNFAQMSLGLIGLNTAGATVVSQTGTQLVIQLTNDAFVNAVGRFTDNGPEALNFNAGAIIDAAGNLSTVPTGNNNGALVAGNVSAAVAGSGQITNSAALVGQDRADTLVGDTTNATVFTGNGGNDDMTAGAGVVDTFVFSLAATNGSDIIRNFDVANDILTLNAVAGVLPGAGVMNVAAAGQVNFPTADVWKFADNVASLTNLSVVAGYLNSDVAAPGTPRVQVVANGTAGDARTILLIDNGVDTGVYLFSDDATVNNTVEASELTLLATLVGVGDATTVTNFTAGL